MGSSFNIRLSGTSLLLMNGQDIIRLRHDYHNHDILRCSFQMEAYQDSIAIHKQEVIAVLSKANRLTNIQWLQWSNFDAIVRISSSTSQDAIAHEVVYQISDLIQGDNIFSYVDLVISGQSNSKLCFIFNKGFTSCPVQLYITSILSNNVSMIELCKNAGISEIIFWDAITMHKKILPVENLLLMVDAKS